MNFILCDLENYSNFSEPQFAQLKKGKIAHLVLLIGGVPVELESLLLCNCSPHFYRMTKSCSEQSLWNTVSADHLDAYVGGEMYFMRKYISTHTILIPYIRVIDACQLIKQPWFSLVPEGASTHSEASRIQDLSLETQWKVCIN